jgi:hypothetical protein
MGKRNDNDNDDDDDDDDGGRDGEGGGPRLVQVAGRTEAASGWVFWRPSAASGWVFWKPVGSEVVVRFCPREFCPRWRSGTQKLCG